MRHRAGATGALLALVVIAGGVAAPTSALGSCAGTATFEQVAREPGSAVFTGSATGVVGENDDLLFTVDRWFHGPEAARVVLLLGWSAVLLESPATGVVPVALAKTVSGDVISLIRDEPVLMIATWTQDQNGFGVYACSIAGVSLDSPEGREALSAAEAVFGSGRSAAALPPTDALAADDGAGRVAGAGLRDWWPLVCAFAMAAVIVLIGHRSGGRVAALRR